jgi:hypothetical protein
LNAAFTSTTAALWQAPLFTVAFLWLALAVGRRVLRWFGSPHGAGPIELGTLAAALGIACLQIVPFALGAVGLLRPVPLRLALGLVALALFNDLVVVGRRATAWVRERAPRDRWLLLWLLALVPGLLVLVAVALAPTYDIDGMVYHLTVPKRWLTSGWMHYLPTYPYSNTPMGIQILFGVGLVFGGDSAAKALSLACALLAFLAVFQGAARLRGPVAGAAATTFVVLIYASRAGSLGSAYIEGALMMAMCGAVLAWLLWLESGQLGWLRAAALLAGSSVSFKISCGGFAIILLALTGFALRERARRQPGGAAVGPTLLGLAALIALPAAPWMVRAAIETGNPFFPMLTGLLPTRDLTPESAHFFSFAMRYQNWGGAFVEGLSIARRQQLLVGIGVTLAVLLGGIAAFVVRSAIARAAAVAALALFLLQLASMGLNSRLWMPSLAALAIPGVALAGRALALRGISVGLVALAALGSALHVRKVHKEVGLPALGRALTSAEGRRQLLVGLYPMSTLQETSNRQLPPDAHVLLEHFAGAFYIDRDTYCDEFVQDALRFDDWNQFDADVRRLGITHMIIPKDPPTVKHALVDRAAQYAAVHRLARLRGHLLEEVDGVQLYAIGPPGEIRADAGEIADPRR